MQWRNSCIISDPSLIKELIVSLASVCKEEYVFISKGFVTDPWGVGSGKPLSLSAASFSCFSRYFRPGEEGTWWRQEEKEGQEEEQRAKRPQSHQKAKNRQEGKEEGQENNNHNFAPDHNKWEENTKLWACFTDHLDLIVVKSCVRLIFPAIPTEPPTEPYTDYPYPDAGEWHTCRGCLKNIDSVDY